MQTLETSREINYDRRRLFGAAAMTQTAGGKIMPQNSVDTVVADDSVLSEIFKECGYSVRTALDGFEALAEIRNQAPCILLSDLNMARMS